MIECAIEIAYRELMYFSQAGMFYISELNHEEQHGMSLDIPRTDDSVHKCEPILGNLFTIASGGAPDWVLSPEGGGGARVIMLAWPADMLWESRSKQSGRTEDCTRLPILEGGLISEFANGQSDDQQPKPMAED